MIMRKGKIPIKTILLIEVPYLVIKFVNVMTY